MRSLPMVLIVSWLLAGCAGYHSRPDDPGLAYEAPPPGSATQTVPDGFYDGGIDDPDLSPRAMALPE